jgi:hypothetical protein
MGRQLDLALGHDDDPCYVCKKPIPRDGKGVGVTVMLDGEFVNYPYHGHCYNAEQLKKRRAKGKNNRTPKHSTRKTR